MNKIMKTFLAVLAGVDVTITIFTPILLATLWVTIAGFDYSSYILYGLGLIATIFRAIKIGWMK